MQIDGGSTGLPANPDVAWLRQIQGWQPFGTRKVPLPHCIDPDGTPPRKHYRIVGCAQGERRLCVIGLRGWLKQRPSGSEIAHLHQLLALFDEKHDSLGIKDANRRRIRRERPGLEIVGLGKNHSPGVRRIVRGAVTWCARLTRCRR